MASFPHSLAYVVPTNEAGAKINQSDNKLLIAAGQEFKMDLMILD